MAMTGAAVHIKPFDLQEAIDHEYLALNDYANCLQAEALPDDPPIPAEEHIARLRHIPPFRKAFAWAAWSPDKMRVVASSRVDSQILTRINISPSSNLGSCLSTAVRGSGGGCSS